MSFNGLSVLCANDKATMDSYLKLNTLLCERTDIKQCICCACLHQVDSNHSHVIELTESGEKAHLCSESCTWWNAQEDKAVPKAMEDNKRTLDHIWFLYNRSSNDYEIVRNSVVSKNFVTRRY